MDTLYRSWQLSGWLYHDIFVIIVAIIFIVISGILVISLIRRRSTRRLVPYALILLVYLAVVHFAGLIFFGMFRSVTIEEKSATFYSEKTKGLTSIERMIIPNGRTNGISTSNSLFQVISVNSQTGERMWSKRLGWRDYLIGQTDQYVVLNNADNEAIYLLDTKTGKKQFSEADLVKKFSELKDYLSSDFVDYRFMDNRYLYIYGLNNRYYQLDLKNWQLKQYPTFKEVFQTQEAPKWTVDSNESQIGQKLSSEERTTVQGKLEEQLIAPVLLGKKDEANYYVLSYKKRQSNQAIVGLYNWQKKTYEWQTPLLLTKENVPIEAFQVEDALFIKVSRYLYKINLNNGNQEYQFDYRWGQVIR